MNTPDRPRGGRFRASACLVPALAAASAPAFAAIPWTPPAGYTLVFSDDFDTAAINPSRWGYRVSGNSHPGNVTINLAEGYDGALQIDLTRVTAGHGFGGGGLVSKHPFGYGYYEVRAKLHNGLGWHPAFWGRPHTEDESQSIVFAQQITELDFFENKEQPNYTDFGWIRWRTGSLVGTHASHQVGPRGVSYGDTTGWHVYQCYYTPGRITWKVDGVTVHDQTINSTDASVAGFVPNTPIHVYLSVIQSSPAAQANIDANKPVGHVYGSVWFDYFKYCRLAAGEPQFFTPAETQEFEAGSFIYGSPGTTWSTISHAPSGGGAYLLANPAAVGTDWIRFKPRLHRAGRYLLTVRLRNWTNRGIFQAAVDPTGANAGYTNLGAPIDNYHASADHTEHAVGLVTFAGGGLKDVKFTLVGKNPASTGTTGGFDRICFYPAETLVDNSSPGFFPSAGSTWSPSSLAGHDGGSTAYSNTAGASATWRPNLLVGGAYKVEFYKVANAVGDPLATLQLCDGSGGVLAQTTVDFTQGPSGWITLAASASLTPATGVQVKLVRNSGYIRADAVRLSLQ